MSHNGSWLQGAGFTAAFGSAALSAMLIAPPNREDLLLSLAGQLELNLVVKTDFGEAATLRPQLLRLVQKRLALADIPLVG